MMINEKPTYGQLGTKTVTSGHEVRTITFGILLNNSKLINGDNP